MSKKYYGNEQYYIDAFEKLDAVGKNTWNWAAFFFGPSWMAYRKMYAYSFIALLLTYSFVWTMIAPLFAFTPFIPFGAMSGGGPFLAHILFGLFGNALYYQVVKKRIARGYHLVENFRPTSIPCGLSYGFFGFVSFFADEFLKRQHFQRTNQINSDWL